jgi:hypothetical protein
MIEIIPPEIVTVEAGTGYLVGESDDLNWGIKKIYAQEFQEFFSTKPRIKVGIIDTGVDILHPDLQGNIYMNPLEIAGNGLDDDNNGYIDDVTGYNFASNSGNVSDVHSHGTHVAGIVGAVVNGTGIYGTYSRALLVPLKALSDSGIGSTYDISRAIRYAADTGVPVINMSLGGPGTPSQSNLLCSSITYARSKGTVSIVSAGNSNVNVSTFIPAGCQDAITVGALDGNFAKPGFSNYGTGVTVSAPGVSIYSTIPGGRYGNKSGTSMAGPFVAGAVAGIFAASGMLDTDRVKQILTQNATGVVSGVPMGKILDMRLLFANLNVAPNPSPVITLSGAANMDTALGLPFIDPGATCVDDKDPLCTVTASGVVNTSLSGVYQITYGAMDSSGNLAVPVIRNVRVTDLTAPLITLSGAALVNLVVGTPFVDPGATCVDNYDPTCTVTVSGTVNTALTGSYRLEYSAVDASLNRSIATRIVEVTMLPMQIPPVITLSGAANMDTALGLPFIDPGATCVDDKDPLCTVTASGVVNTSLSGVYQITYGAMDSSGNLALPVIRNVRVTDLTAPVITLSGGALINIVVGTPFVDPGVTCVDNYDPTCTVTVSGTVNTALTGSYRLKYSAVDTSLNSRTGSIRDVIVYELSNLPNPLPPTPVPPPSNGGGSSNVGPG